MSVQVRLDNDVVELLDETRGDRTRGREASELLRALLADDDQPPPDHEDDQVVEDEPPRTARVQRSRRRIGRTEAVIRGL